MPPAGADAPADSLRLPPANADAGAGSRRVPPARVRAWQTGLFRADRLRHASLSFTIAAGAGIATGSRRQAFALTLALGTVKEFDDARSTRFDFVDLAADALGAALGASVAARP